MDVLPLALQSRILEDALCHEDARPRRYSDISAVSRLGREAATRAAVLSSDSFFDEGEDGPPCVPTWVVHRMVPGPPLTPEATAAALQNMAQRFEQLTHVSVSLRPQALAADAVADWDAEAVATAQVGEGLAMFAQHVVPALANATQLTIRGSLEYSGRRAPVLWRQLAATQLGAACTRLDLTADPVSVAELLHNMASFFPAVRGVRVRHHCPVPLDGLQAPLSVNAPDCLTHLCVVSSSHHMDCQAGVFVNQARGLQVLVHRFVPEAVEAQSALLRFLGDAGQTAPALHTIRGFSRVSPYHNPMPALRHLETTVLRTWSTWDGVGLGVVKRLLLEFDVRAPGLTSMWLLVRNPALSEGEVVELRAWAALSLRFACVLVASAGCPDGRLEREGRAGHVVMH